MRQATDAEIVWGLKYHLSRLTPAIRNRFASRNAAERDGAIRFMAEYLAKEALGRFEILASGESGTLVDTLYDRAAFGEGQLKVDEDTVPIGPVPERP